LIKPVELWAEPCRCVPSFRRLRVRILSIEGAVVTIDAMGCQRDVAAKIVEKKADYILALKGNQGTLHEDVEVRR
jgi:predicted transposase YbfD/YdcC